MKEEIKNFKIGQPRLKKIHGYTKIELTDAKTGRKQITEDENTFQTSVLSDYMRSLGVFNNNPFTLSEWRSNFWQNLVGGIFCFEDTITEGTKYMPAGNTMRANGSYGVANSATPVELGSYNSIESSVGNTSITQVYDWTTSQGNGTIGCVCLTSQTGGYIGYGNPSGSYTSTSYVLERNQNSNNISSTPTNSFIYDNYRYVISLSGQTLTIEKTPLAVTQASIFNGVGAKTTTFTLSNTYSGTALTSYEMYTMIDDGKVYMFFHNNGSSYSDGKIASGGTTNYVVYDLANNSITEKTFTNTTGATITMRSGSSAGMFLIMDGYMYVSTGSNYSTYSMSPTYKIDLSDYSTVETFTGVDIGSSLFGKLAPGLIRIGANVYDPVNDTWYPCNIGTSFDYIAYEELNDAMYNGSSGVYKYKNPLYLATINNLDTAVTKDNTQTMKITYTLTEA